MIQLISVFGYEQENIRQNGRQAGHMKNHARAGESLSLTFHSHISEAANQLISQIFPIDLDCN
tara:strand:+ start:150 stop:338 length:189 start_codon:yes stop_codon:yes gene_type:complete